VNLTILVNFDSTVKENEGKFKQQGSVARYVFMFCAAYVISEITLYNLFLINTVLIVFLFRKKNGFGVACSLISDVRQIFLQFQ